MHPPSFSLKPLSLAFLAVSLLAGCGQGSDYTVEEHIQRAKDFQSRGDTSASIIELKNAVQKNPEHAQARWLLGMVYLDLRLGNEAETQLEKSVQLGISKSNALIPLARAQYYQGNFQNTLDTLAAFDSEAPGALSQALALRGNALFKLDKSAEACPLFERAITVDKAYAPAYQGRARCEFRDKHIASAIASAKQATVLEPTRLDAWYLLGDLYRSTNQPELALAAYDQALKIKADDFDALAFKAMTLLSTQRVTEADALIKQIGKQRPQAPLYKYLYAYQLYKQGKHNDAANLLQQVLKENPENAQAHLLYGTVNYALKNDETALASFNKALSAGDSPDTRVMLAATQLRMRANADVMRTLAPLLAEENNPKALLLAGQAALNLKEFDRGMAYLAKASTLDPRDSVIRTTLAQQQLQAGDQQGIRGLESVLTDNPNDTQAYLLLAAAQIGKANLPGALATLQKMAAAQPTNPLTQVLIGRVYLMQKNPLAARQAFQKSLSADAGFLPAASELAGLDIREKKPAQAREHFQRILAKAPDNLGARLGLAHTALALGDEKDYVNQLNLAIQKHPKAFEPVSELTRHYIAKARQPQRALEVAQKAAQANKGHLGFMDNLGQALLSAGRKKEAIETYTAITNAQVNSPVAWYRLAWAQRVAGELNAALSSLQKATRLAPSYIDAHVALAGLLSVMGQTDKALQETRAIQELAPQSAIGYNMEAELATRLKKPDMAFQAKARAFQSVSSPETTATYHLALLRAGKAPQAEQIAQLWLKQHPADTAFRNYLAGAYLHQDQIPAAIAQYQKIILIDPNHLGALNNLASLLQARGNPAAFDFARRAYAIAPDNPAVKDTYGWALYQQGKIQDALPLLQAAAQQAKPESPDILTHWASALSKAGKHAEAITVLKRALTTHAEFSERNQAILLLKSIDAGSR